MTSLVLLWDVSLVLCVIGAVALLVLLLARARANRSAASWTQARAAILPQLLDGPDQPQRLRGTELEVATMLTSELAEMTAGSERAAMLERASAMGVPALLEARLLSRSAQTRLSAVETLSLFPQYGKRVERVLDDPNPDVRLGAALALAQRDDAPPPSLIVEKLRIGCEERSLLLVSMMRDLAEHDAGAVAGLLFEKDVPYEAKVAATDALAIVGPRYAPLLAYMASDSAGESDLQPRIYRALGRLGHPSGRDTILNGLKSEEWPVRASAAEAAGKSGLAEAADTLGELLADENWWVRFRAGEALLRIGPRGLAVLHAAGASELEITRTTAQAILAERQAA